MISHLNINSIRQKFDRLTETTTGMLISETKLDESFPKGQFSIKQASLSGRSTTLE